VSGFFDTGKPRSHPLLDNLPFKLGQGGDQMREKSPSWRRQIDSLTEADDRAATCIEIVQQEEQVAQRPAQAVEG
jgi:hypothetical protein